MRKRTGFNTKRCISDDIMPEALEMLVQRVSYGGNPEHKRNPGDFGLTPPSQPRPDKSLCDDVGIFSKATAVQLLKDGIRRGVAWFGQSIAPKWVPSEYLGFNNQWCSCRSAA